MRVSAIQFRARKGEPDRSLADLVGYAELAAASSDLVVMPEMAVTGYVFDSRDAVLPLCEPADGPTFRALAAVAARHGAWMVVGLPERDGDTLYNSALIIDPSGALAGVYRKTLLYELDLPWASPGDSGYLRFDTGAGSFGVGICMDLNDDAFIEWALEANVDVLAFPTNWLDEGQNVWGYWAWRLYGVRAALVGANTWGEEAGVGFRGESAIVQGRTVLASAPAVGDGVIGAEVESVAGRLLAP